MEFHATVAKVGAAVVIAIFASEWFPDIFESMNEALVVPLSRVLGGG